MYLAHVHLRNWRSYADGRFEFEPPTPDRRLILIGAMNGHGKTSLLVGLYLGLFGRHGLRYIEGVAGDRDTSYYRYQMARVRRNDASTHEPTSVELIFSPMPGEQQPDVRVRRTWHFDPQGRPIQGDAFEEVILWRDGQPEKFSSSQNGNVEPWKERLERLLFPTQFLPAFFFDGEQAQRMIFEGSDEQFQRDVAVLYGTAAVDNMRNKLKSYTSKVADQAGGKRGEDKKQRRLRDLEQEREKRDREAHQLRQEQARLQRVRDDLERQRQETAEALARLGGDRPGSVQEIQKDVNTAERQLEAARDELFKSVGALGLALAISRLSPELEAQLKAEHAREQWLGVKAQAENKTDAVINHALPEPPESDPLLGFLSTEVRKNVRRRFADAVQLIYNPPPPECAEEFLLGFAAGEARRMLEQRLEHARRIGSQPLKSASKNVQDARERRGDANYRLQRLADLPPETDEHRQRLTTINQEKEKTSQQLGEIENSISSREGQLRDLNREIGALAEEIRNLKPEYRRIDAAERAIRAMNNLSDRLRPLALDRLRTRITRHFLRIADERFRGGEIKFENGRPQLCRIDHPNQPIEAMSGFERRAFGIAYTLALVEATGRRIPLIIDTPLGNADSRYRQRLLDALTEVELDQVIVLPHDAEVPAEMLDVLRPRVQQTFLIDFDQQRRQSRVHPNSYFQRSGAMAWT